MSGNTPSNGPHDVRPTCLLIVPLSFYGFSQVLRRELESRGFKVETENDEFPANTFGKVMGKLGALSLLRWFTLRQFRARYANKPTHFSLVLIVKGRGVGKGLIEFLRSISDRVIAYNFDSFKFNPSPLDWLGGVHRYCTFDIQDAQSHGLPLVHLFTSVPGNIPEVGERYDISVLMKNHSQRLVYADQVLSAVPERSHFLYLFEPNVFSFAFGLVRHPLLYLKYWNDIHFRPLPYDAFLRALGASRVTVDYAHPSQTGLTIRCFEARSLSVSLVTNNQHALGHSSVGAGSAVHFPLGGDRSRLSADIQRLMDRPRTRSSRTVNIFMSELLDDPVPVRTAFPNVSLD